MKEPLISVVVVNWNSKDDLQACLNSLAAQTDQHFETIVADNGSTDGSLEMLRREFPAVRVIETGENLGFAEGCNRGIAETRGEWIATLNNDAEATPTWMAELRAAIAVGNARLGMLQSRTLFKHDTGLINSSGVSISRNGGIADRDFNRPVSNERAFEQILCPSASAALYRKEMLDEVRLETGYFDRTFFMYFEDVDLGWRCRLAGWDACYAPRATVHHAFQGSSRRRGELFSRYHCNRNRVQVLLKNASVAYIARCAWRISREFAWCLLKMGGRALREYGAAWASGHRQRAVVTRLCRVERGALERRWFGRS